MYDITNRDSFKDLNAWHYRLVNENYALKIGVIVGNKLDKANDRKVLYEEGLAFANSLNYAFMEISALNNKNIQELIHTIGLELLN